ncbi:DoxX family membrane protein [bacterium]|nr:DoxX family membrane protein [bacterium]
MKSAKFIRWIIFSIRVFLGLIFFTAGMAKLTQHFPGFIGPVWLEEKLAPYGLGFYARFIAYCQVIVGWLLLTQRFATLGAIMLFPLLLNIFMVTVSLEWRGTPYINFFLLILNGILLAYDFDKLKFILTDDIAELKPIGIHRPSRKSDVFWVGGLLIILISISLVTLSLWAMYAGVGAGFMMLFCARMVQNKN